MAEGWRGGWRAGLGMGTRGPRRRSVGDEALGYEGSGRGEHSGQEPVPTPERLTDALANNRPDQVK